MKNLKIKVCQSRGPSWISVLSVLTADSTGMVFFESALNVTTFTQAQIIRIFPILNAIQGHKLAREFHACYISLEEPIWHELPRDSSDIAFAVDLTRNSLEGNEFSFRVFCILLL